jgi:hypothetical protein
MMNQRIRDLAITGGIYDCICDPYDKLKNGDPYSSVMVDLERFAEKIIQECARVARATPCPYTDELMIQQLGHTWDMASSEAGREIIKHFGVEE